MRNALNAQKVIGLCWILMNVSLSVLMGTLRDEMIKSVRRQQVEIKV